MELMVSLYMLCMESHFSLRTQVLLYLKDAERLYGFEPGCTPIIEEFSFEIYGLF